MGDLAVMSCGDDTGFREGDMQSPPPHARGKSAVEVTIRLPSSAWQIYPCVGLQAWPQSALQIHEGKLTATNLANIIIIIIVIIIIIAAVLVIILPAVSVVTAEARLLSLRRTSRSVMEG